MSNENKTKKVKVTNTNLEQYWLSSISIKQLNDAKNAEEGYKFKNIIPAMAFSVFTVESLANIYGSQLFPHWEHYESTSFIGKIVMISEFFGIKVDFSRDPWQTINTMKVFRNTLVHAKPKTFSEIQEIPSHWPDQAAPLPKTKKTIMDYSSIKMAESFEKAAKELELLWISFATEHGVDLIGKPTYDVQA